MTERPEAAETVLLALMERQISPVEMGRLAGEDGFNEPNNFDFNHMLSPLRDHMFPRDDHFKYMWAIHESGLERLSTTALSFARMSRCCMFIAIGSKTGSPSKVTTTSCL
jgi:hypothetical protein